MTPAALSSDDPEEVKVANSGGVGVLVIVRGGTIDECSASRSSIGSATAASDMSSAWPPVFSDPSTDLASLNGTAIPAFLGGVDGNSRSKCRTSTFSGGLSTSMTGRQFSLLLFDLLRQTNIAPISARKSTTADALVAIDVFRTASRSSSSAVVLAAKIPPLLFRNSCLSPTYNTLLMAPPVPRFSLMTVSICLRTASSTSSAPASPTYSRVILPATGAHFRKDESSSKNSHSSTVMSLKSR
mmetsp:Transcript_1866/g.4095  ORF Transcript_1866/g.4095 Transcript_1866/m.4095 type:complete len:242 (-) Transcript_1866:356-1081(-)